MATGVHSCMHIEPRLRVLLGPREAPNAHCGDSLLAKHEVHLLAIFFLLARKRKESRCASAERKI